MEVWILAPREGLAQGVGGGMWERCAEPTLRDGSGGYLRAKEGLSLRRSQRKDGEGPAVRLVQRVPVGSPLWDPAGGEAVAMRVPSNCHVDAVHTLALLQAG